MVYGWMWIAVIIAAIVIEVLTDQLVSIWFVPAAIVATVLDFCEVKLVWQIFSFLVISALGIVFAKLFLTKLKPAENTRTNIDAIVGSRCVVTERIDNFAGCGQVKVNGQIWSARGAQEEDTFESGEILSIVAIEGVKVICKK